MSDACAPRRIHALADVRVSDGSGFRMETWFHAADEAAVQHVADRVRTVAVEGPFVWTSEDGVASLGSDALRGFVLGHQFHAFVLAFDELVTGAVPMATIPFAGGTHRGRGGRFPPGGSASSGGSAQLISGDDPARPLGMRLVFPGAPPIEVGFADWRPEGPTALPFGVSLNDGERTFEYAYVTVDAREAPPGWFFEDVPEPGIEAVRAYREDRAAQRAGCSAETASGG